LVVFDAYAAEVARVDQNGDGIISMPIYPSRQRSDRSNAGSYSV
jgi:hypothetical protein